MLGIPIPPIFVSQRDDGVWDVVDGQQRLSTILEFVGELKKQGGELLPFSTLSATHYLPSLEGMTFKEGDTEHCFTQDLQFIFKREKLDFKIVKRESDNNIKYELFQRLNNLGSRLSDQEVRNCLMVMLNPTFFNWLNSLANYPAFLEVISVADRLLKEQYHLELTLRFLILTNVDPQEIKRIQDLGDFITKKMREYCENPNFDYTREQSRFEKSFDLLNAVLGSDSLKRYNPSKDKFEGSFLISGFEAVGIALGRNIEKWKNVLLTTENQSLFIEKVQSIWKNVKFQESSGAGNNVTRRVPVIIPIGEEMLVP